MKNSTAVIVNQQYESKQKKKIPASQQTINKLKSLQQDTTQQQNKSIDTSAFNNGNQLLKSYATVLNQSLITKDKHILKELLSEGDEEIIINSIKGVEYGKVGLLLEQIEILLLEEVRETKNTMVHLKWLKNILKTHIGTIINNPEVQVVAGRLSNILKKRSSHLENHEKLVEKIPDRITANGGKAFTPKFYYIEEEKDIIHREEGQGESQDEDMNGNEEEDMGEFQDFMDDGDMGMDMDLM